jgi:hypothetical protein
MDFNTILNTGLIFSAITYFGYQLRAIPEVIWNFIKRKITFNLTIIETDELYLYMERWLLHNHKNSYRNVEASLSPQKFNSMDLPHEEIPEEKKDEDKLHLWQFSDNFFIYYRNRRILISKGREKLEGAKDLRNAFLNSFTISGIFAKKSILKLIEEVIQFNQQFKKERFPRIYTNTDWGDWNFSGENYSKSFDNIFFKDKECLISDINNFLENKTWYQKRGIPYKRGYLFYGLPGNGKTAIVQAIARHFKKDIYYISLNNIESDSNLSRLYSNMKFGSLVVFEDVDAYFEGRKNNKEKGISFSMLLNCLDGIFSQSGTITIMTTNHPEKLDPALIRHGRIDVKMEITNPNKSEVEKYLQNFYEVESIQNLTYPDGSLSMVQIQDICLLNKDSLENTLNTINQMTVKELV